MPRRLQQMMELLGWCRLVHRRRCLPHAPFEEAGQPPSPAPLRPPVIVPRALPRDTAIEDALADTYELVSAFARKTRVSDALMCECFLVANGRTLEDVAACEYVIPALNGASVL